MFPTLHSCVVAERRIILVRFGSDDEVNVARCFRAEVPGGVAVACAPAGEEEVVLPVPAADWEAAGRDLRVQVAARIAVGRA